MNIINNYGPAAVIVFGYIIAAFWQAKRFDDLKEMLGAKIDRLEGVMDARFMAAREGLLRVEQVLGARLKHLEERER